jgi:hypothetical protein
MEQKKLQKIQEKK